MPYLGSPLMDTLDTPPPPEDNDGFRPLFGGPLFSFGSYGPPMLPSFMEPPRRRLPPQPRYRGGSFRSDPQEPEYNDRPQARGNLPRSTSGRRQSWSSQNGQNKPSFLDTLRSFNRKKEQEQKKNYETYEAPSHDLDKVFNNMQTRVVSNEEDAPELFKQLFQGEMPDGFFSTNNGAIVIRRTTSQPPQERYDPDTTAANGAEVDNDFITAALKIHNYYRKKHDCQPLEYDFKAQEVAQDWANYLVATGTFEHRRPNTYGENLFTRSAGILRLSGDNFGPTKWEEDTAAVNKINIMQIAVKGFYNEIKDYHWLGGEPDMTNFKDWGHFTQVVWNGSKWLGMGVATKGGRTVVVANYYPKGNCIGAFGKNVPRLKSFWKK